MQVLTEVHIWPWRTNLSNVADASALVQTTGYFGGRFCQERLTMNIRKQENHEPSQGSEGKNTEYFVSFPTRWRSLMKHQ